MDVNSDSPSNPANPTSAPPPNLKTKVKTFWATNKRYLPAEFFVAGFLFDVITLARIDDWFSIIQQSLYIAVIILILRKKTLEQAGLWQPGEKFTKIWKYHDEGMHFLFGSLLSIYALFFFLSSSFATSFGFLMVMFAVLVVNEMPQFQAQGLVIKYALLALCLFSFFAYLVPLTIGFIGLIPFLIAIGIVAILFWTIYQDFAKRENFPLPIKKIVLVPAGAVGAVLVLMYFLKMLPPIPLSIQYIGIYHGVEKQRPVEPAQGETKFILKYDRPFWKFWQSGAQDFVAYNGDKLFVFVRIFSPTNFKDKIVFNWLQKMPSGWMSSDRINIEITGGRDEGFRGYAFKSNFDPGAWRVQVETEDGREIGRIQFHVEKTGMPEPADRVFKTDVY